MTKSKNPVTYKAPHDVYVDDKYFIAGEPFTTAKDPGKSWERISKAEKAASDASDPDRGDVPLESLSKAALEAVAAGARVNPAGLSKEDLISAIKAAETPKA